MAFHVGQKVVCVDDTYMNLLVGETGPQFGVIYTIREIDVDECDTCLRLEEVRNEPPEYAYGIMECAFYSWRFRPVIQRKTDISIFTDMLNPKSVKEDA